MNNILLKTWQAANKETRTDFVIEMVKRYHHLICAVL